MIRQLLPPPLRRTIKRAAEMSLPLLETFTGFRTARGDYLPNRFRILLRRYEREELDLIRPFVANARTIFDVGANVGYVSRFFARTTAPTARVFSFEPNPIIFPLLANNVRVSAKVRAFNFGLSDSEAEMPLFLAGDDHSVGSFAQDYPAQHALYQNAGRVRSVAAKLMRGDDFAQREGIQQIDAMKIDVEGWELNVLNGLEQTISRSFALVIFCEYNRAAQQAAGRAPHDLPGWFLARGFTVSVRDGTALRELPRDPQEALAALPTQTAYPTLFALRS